MNVLIVAPTTREYKNITSTLAKYGKTRNTYTVSLSGIGKAGAAAATVKAIAEAATPYNLIAVIGYAAGSLGFRQAEIVVPFEARYHDCDIPDGFIPEITDPIRLAPKKADAVTVFTGDSFVNSRSVGEIKARFGVDRAIFDMEIMAVAIAARMSGNIPVMAVKMISDVPEDGHTEHSYDEFADTHSDFTGILEKIETVEI